MTVSAWKVDGDVITHTVQLFVKAVEKTVQKLLSILLLKGCKLGKILLHQLLARWR